MGGDTAPPVWRSLRIAEASCSSSQMPASRGRAQRPPRSLLLLLLLLLLPVAFSVDLVHCFCLKQTLLLACLTFWLLSRDHKAKETYYKATETYYKAKETYYKAKQKKPLDIWRAHAGEHGPLVTPRRKSGEGHVPIPGLANCYTSSPAPREKNEQACAQDTDTARARARSLSPCLSLSRSVSTPPPPP